MEMWAVFKRGERISKAFPLREQAAKHAKQEYGYNEGYLQGRRFAYFDDPMLCLKSFEGDNPYENQKAKETK